MIWPYQSSSLQIRIAALLIIAQPVGLGDDQDPPANPEVIQELLETVGRLTRSSWGECPYLGLRVRPSFVSDIDESGYVLVVFDVSKVGRAINAEVIESNVDKARQAEALELITLFRFRPVVREDEVLVYENWVERVDFPPEDAEPDPTWPQPERYMDERCR
jgi:TonB family protein